MHVMFTQHGLAACAFPASCLHHCLCNAVLMVALNNSVFQAGSRVLPAAAFNGWQMCPPTLQVALVFLFN